ncbi:MAG: redoxin domain-containing protein [Rhodothermales bacterium]
MDTTLFTIMAIFMIAAGTGFIYFIVRGNEKPRPQGGTQWAAVVLSALLMVFSGFLLALSLAPGENLEDRGTEVGQDELDKPAKNFTFRLVSDDTEKELEDYRGKVVLLNFWATWCAPCIREIPELDRLQKNYADDGLVILSITDEPKSDLMAYQDLIPKETVTGYVEASQLPQPFQRTLAGRPSTYIIDREGIMRRYILGAGTYTFFEQVVSPYLQDTLATR